MLTVGAMGAGSVNYHSGLAKEDYYSKGQEPPGVWIGTGAEEIGLSGIVKRTELKNVFYGFSPDGKEKFVQNAGKMTGDKSRDPGWDLTFSAPKSVSICWAISEPEVRQIIERAHFESVKETIRDIESQTVIRKGKGGCIHEQAGLVVATYQHSTSRAINKQTLPDMELHTHCLTINMGVSPTDGKTRAIKSNLLYEKQQDFGAGYRTRFAQKLTAIGFQCEKTEHSFELKGVSRELIEEFSKRTEQVKAQTEGITDKREVEKVKLRGRTVKDSYSREDLFSHWKSRCEELGFNASKVLELTDLPRPYERSVEIEKSRAVEAAVKKLTEEKPFFTKDELQRSISHEATEKGLGFREVIEATKAFIREKAIPLGNKDGREVFTTDATAERETKNLIEREKAAEKEKTVLLSDYRKELEKDGFRVLGCTFSKVKAQEFIKDTGINTRTIRKALYDLEDKKPTTAAEKFKKDQDNWRKIDAQVLYSTWKINSKQKAKMLGETHKPTSKIIHEFKYATWQISKAHRDFLNRELEKEKNKITEKTVVVIDAKPTTKGDIKKLVDEIEKRGGRVIFTEDAIQGQQQKRQIAEMQRKQQEKKPEPEQETFIQYKR
jgi:conjugative relaxase-like TrwC/TraI family protein